MSIPEIAEGDFVLYDRFLAGWNSSYPQIACRISEAAEEILY